MESNWPRWGDESHFSVFIFKYGNRLEKVSGRLRDVTDSGTCGNDLGACLSAAS